MENRLVVSAARSRWTTYGFAVFCAVAGLVLRLPFAFYLGDKNPHVTFFLAIAVSASVGGLGPGIVTTLLGALLAAFFIIPPTGSFALREPNDYLGLAIFLGVGAYISHLAGRSIRATRHENALRLLFQQMLVSIGDAVIATDAGKNVRFMNPVAERLTGWTEAEAKGRQIAEVFRIVREGTDTAAEIPIDQILKTALVSGLDNQVELIAKTGSRVPIDDSGAPIRNQRGDVVGAVLVFRDITARRQAERHRAEDQRALVQAQKLESIGLLAGGIAHDFNNLLVGIMGGASCAMEVVPASSPAFPMLESVVLASERAAHLTRQMLAYAGKGRFVIEPVDLSLIATETADLVRASIAKSVKVELQLHERLPAVHTDASQMQQVAMNLMINAAESIRQGGQGVVTVRTRPEEIVPDSSRRDLAGNPMAPGLYAALEVEDSGSGVDPAILNKIFDPFFTTKFTGHGLGLAAVSGIVRSHHGAIEVETTSGQGSTFRVLLPARYTRHQPTVIRSRDTAGTNTGTVLVIDDEATVRNVAKTGLENSGYRTIVAVSGQEGLEYLRLNQDISLVLLDMSMPEMSGRQVLEALQELRPTVPVIISSGFSEDEVHRQFSGLKMAGVLPKPFTVKRLVAQVRSVLHGTP